MFVILSYDVHRKRVHKVHKVVKKYLHWVHNSVFEGEISLSQMQKLISQLDDIVKHNYDSVVFYIYPNDKYVVKKYIGIDKSWLSSNIL
ncbi:MAG TPA: CRISPR-associated endonuclease Cas2 [Candidatus Kapabacteria bacterium]|jgi:CRISPR-associated protein Cas2|nr:CRISPR-associated endonuclease Cas2 [Ignavibacteria bacterium]HOK14598.1 CRISPR-associated endonuclease Cas2 [Candidatus Kapabacteria bacterium]HOM03940.1 CRISPR-associated endonuclease Cas2 [Candidatus Kapabacteria bacterium]HOQ48570.1 CRISPR-associated endonuclease Cas2 [Candidatus Kapabacteria bacterium]HPP39463.1 CRISPR-associated endonuclease Cas2 [Candidatus Kapabacteria bacterium]